VDDQSQDNSLECIRNYIQKTSEYQTVTIMRMARYQGLEISMNAGVDLAIGDLIFEFDTIEPEFDNAFIMEAHKKVISGNDIVSAVPKKVHSIFSTIFYRIYNWAGGGTIYREGFRIVSRRALNRIKAANRFIPYRKALYAQSGLQSDKIYYTGSVHDRKQYSGERINLALDALILFTGAVQKVSFFICLLFGLLTISIGVYITYIYFGPQKPIEGWTPIMGFMVLGFFGVFFLFAIIFKYLSVILNTVFIKQWYMVKSIEKL
jgi:dolichol-phosphate mannosyltransferase